MLPLDGGFQSDARGYDPARRIAPVLFTPAGWEHRDSMARLGGRFATISRLPTMPGGSPSASADAVALDHPRLLSLGQSIVVSTLSDRVDPMRVEELCTVLFDAARGASFAAAHTSPALMRAVERLAAGPPWPSIAALAAEAGMSAAHFTRAFRKRFGCSPSEWRSALQAERAAHSIRTRDAGLAGAAAEAGYADQSHLGRAFRCLYFCSPGVYRALMGRAAAADYRPPSARPAR